VRTCGVCVLVSIQYRAPLKSRHLSNSSFRFDIWLHFFLHFIIVIVMMGIILCVGVFAFVCTLVRRTLLHLSCMCLHGCEISWCMGCNLLLFKFLCIRLCDCALQLCSGKTVSLLLNLILTTQLHESQGGSPSKTHIEVKMYVIASV